MSVDDTFTYPYKLPPGLRKKKVDGTYYPLLNIQLYNCDGGKPLSFEGLLDSGADGLFIPKQIAELLSLPNLGTKRTSGVLKTSECIKTKVGFRIGRTRARRIDFGVVEVTYPQEESDIPILVGRTPLFDFFEVRFLQYTEKPKIELIQKKPLD